MTLTGTDYTFMPVTITGSAGAASTINSEIESGPSFTTPTTTTSSKASGSGNAASQSSSTTTSSSKAGGPAITGNAVFVMGVVAVAVLA